MALVLAEKVDAKYGLIPLILDDACEDMMVPQISVGTSNGDSRR